MSGFLKTIEASFDFRGTKTTPQAETRRSFPRGCSKAEHNGILIFLAIKPVENVNKFREKNSLPDGLPAQEPCLDKSLIEMIFVRYSFRFRDVVFKLFSVLKTGQAARVGASVEHFVMSNTTRYSFFNITNFLNFIYY